MTKFIVVYHSGYGHTKAVAEQVAKGAGANLVAISGEGEITPVEWAARDAADAIIFGTATYMGNVIGQLSVRGSSGGPGFHA